MHVENLRAFISLSYDQLSLSGKFPLLNSSRKALGYMSLPGETLGTLTGTCLFSGLLQSLYTSCHVSWTSFLSATPPSDHHLTCI